jgi:hypothetical protein
MRVRNGSPPGGMAARPCNVPPSGIKQPVFSASSAMFYALVACSLVAFVVHLVFLDRLQRFRIRPLRGRGWWGMDLFSGMVQYPYSPKSYTGDAGRLLGWLYASGIAWLLFVSLAAVALRSSLR